MIKQIQPIQTSGIKRIQPIRHQAIRTFSPRYITTSPNCTVTIAFLVNKLLSWDDYRRTAVFLHHESILRNSFSNTARKGKYFLNNKPYM